MDAITKFISKLRRNPTKYAPRNKGRENNMASHAPNMILANSLFGAYEYLNTNLQMIN